MSTGCWFFFLRTLQTYNGVIAHRQAVVHEAYQMGRDVAENIFGTQKRRGYVFHLTDTQTEQLAWRYRRRPRPSSEATVDCVSAVFNRRHPHTPRMN